ncbi:hypothetical protein [Dyadobacter psychrotolerans]|uniref:Uncharacterized protein n=1 Tax=Dyadobacter psychrotolerans TaxID=2541721 RepID=A0A4R5DS79_9BACT|nr:hypothetical protein [Dyadobacter psychrotolerans]TDE17189.1 hypothetical protein E0F88_04635 [Dyadobacter psychrotolerans]
MEDSFLLDVNYKGEIREFEGQLVLQGYLHKIQIDVDGLIITFEPDEERNYRAVADPNEGVKVDKELIPAIAQRLESLLKK